MIENPDALAGKAQRLFDNKRNKNIVFGIGAVIAALAAGFVMYEYYISNQNREAQEEMFQAVYFYEADSLGKALNGDGNNYGFLDIIDLYGGTDAANLASFYAGSAYLKLGDYQSAARSLSAFRSNDILVRARAYSLIGDAHMEQGNFPEAAKFYEKAADHKPNEGFSPIYLQKLAIAREANADISLAAEAYGKIVDDFQNSSLLEEAKKHKARLEGLVAE